MGFVFAACYRVLADACGEKGFVELPKLKRKKKKRKRKHKREISVYACDVDEHGEKYGCTRK